VNNLQEQFPEYRKRVCKARPVNFESSFYVLDKFSMSLKDLIQNASKYSVWVSLGLDFVVSEEVKYLRFDKGSTAKS
jgi:hypothetical protein